MIVNFCLYPSIKKQYLKQIPKRISLKSCRVYRLSQIIFVIRKSSNSPRGPVHRKAAKKGRTQELRLEKNEIEKFLL